MELFRKIAQKTADHVGSPFAFIAAVALLITWACTGPLMRFSNTWQLLINTTTTIITFLMVFLIQNAQHRDGRSLHLKLDELIRATKGAKNSMLDLSKLSDLQLRALERQYERLCELPDEIAAEEAAREHPLGHDPDEAGRNRG